MSRAVTLYHYQKPILERRGRYCWETDGFSRKPGKEPVMTREQCRHDALSRGSVAEFVGYPAAKPRLIA